MSPFKSKYLTTITEAITLWGLLTILVFKMYNRLNTGLKIDTKRMRVCKNAKYIITSLSFAQFRNSRYHQNQDIISYILHELPNPKLLLQQLQVCGRHYNCQPYYYSLPTTTTPDVQFCTDQQKKFDYSAPIRDIELKFWGYAHLALT